MSGMKGMENTVNHYHFDEIINRKNTNSLKYDFAVERNMPEDLLPLWVADMDFRTADGILEELHKVVEHGIFGYSKGKEEYYQAVRNWFSRHFSWTPKKEWFVKTPGVVFALASIVRALTKEGDGVFIQQPVYYPFASIITKNKRKLVNNELMFESGKYRMDLKDMEEKIQREHVKMFILCNPHNPVGRVWTKEELRRVGELCCQYGVKIVSDEIHCDFTYKGHQHTVFASISEEFQENSIVCTAPSKTFNLAGLQISNIFIPNKEWRKKVEYAIWKTGYDELNIMGLTACKAAYEKGEPWLLKLKQYLKGNLDYVRSFLEDNLPNIKLVEPEGTYLIWLDFKGLGMTEEEINERIVKEAKLWLDPGSMFGRKSGMFQRINIACPRKILEEAMNRLKASFT